MAALVKHAITEKTAKQLLFRGGVYYKNFKVQDTNFDGVVLGATSGGGKISIEQEYLDAELDGAGVKLKGGKIKVGETATMEINFTEIRPDIIAKGLHMKKDDSFKEVAGYEKYSSQDDILDTDYEENIAFVGELNSGKYAIVVFSNMNRQDIDFEDSSIIIHKTKSKVERIVFLNDVAKYYLKEYLSTRTDDMSPTFLSNKKNKWSIGAIEARLNKIGEISGICNVHPHRFRRTFATCLHQKGMSIRSIQQLMGHSDINTTVIYIGCDKTFLKREYERFS